MSADELRAGFARLAGPVLPGGDPYGQLIRQSRRRRRARFAGLGAALTGVLVSALLGPMVLTAGSDGPGQRNGGPAWPGHLVESTWTWRLIDSPTRGNLAGDAALVRRMTQAFADDRSPARVTQALPEVKVLFVHDFAESRAVAVAYHSDTAAALVTRTARRGASVEDLVTASGAAYLPVTPFTVLTESLDSGAGWAANWTVALAPAGCTIDGSDSAIFTADRQLRRTWQPVPSRDHVISEGTSGRQPPPTVWRVTCDGKVRQQGPLTHTVAEVTADPDRLKVNYDGAVAPEVASVDREFARLAYATYQQLVGAARIGNVMLMDASPVVRWAGTLPESGDSTPAALIAPQGWTGPAVLWIGTNPKAMVALAPPAGAATGGRPVPDDQETMDASRAQWSLAATAMATSGALVAVRIPERDGGRAVLSDRLMLLGSAGATSVEVVDGNGKVVGSVTLSGGAGVLTVPVGAKVTLRSRDAAGKQLATAPLFEPATGERLFGEATVSDW